MSDFRTIQSANIKTQSIYDNGRVEESQSPILNGQIFQWNCERKKEKCHKKLRKRGREREKEREKRLFLPFSFLFEIREKRREVVRSSLGGI